MPEQSTLNLVDRGASLRGRRFLSVNLEEGPDLVVHGRPPLSREAVEPRRTSVQETLRLSAPPENPICTVTGLSLTGFSTAGAPLAPAGGGTVGVGAAGAGVGASAGPHGVSKMQGTQAGLDGSGAAGSLLLAGLGVVPGGGVQWRRTSKPSPSAVLPKQKLGIRIDVLEVVVQLLALLLPCWLASLLLACDESRAAERLVRR